MTPPPFESDDHALHAGMFIGWVMRQGVRCHPLVDDEGNYLNEIVIDTDEGPHFHVIVKPPQFDHKQEAPQ